MEACLRVCVRVCMGVSVNLHYCPCGCVKGRASVFDGVIRSSIDIRGQ